MQNRTHAHTKARNQTKKILKEKRNPAQRPRKERRAAQKKSDGRKGKRSLGSRGTYVVIASITEAAKVGDVPLRLVGRWWRTAAAGRGLWNRRRRGLRRGNTRVHGRSTQARLRLVGRGHGGIAHVGRALLVGEAELQAIGPAGGTAVGHVARGSGRGDGHRGLPRVVALRGSRSRRGAIHDGHTRRGLLGGLVLHGFAVHRRY